MLSDSTMHRTARFKPLADPAAAAIANAKLHASISRWKRLAAASPARFPIYDLFCIKTSAHHHRCRYPANRLCRRIPKRPIEILI